MSHASGAQRYALAVESYSNIAARSEAVEHVIQCGTVGAPGVSDIDVILVLRDSPGFAERLLLFNPEVLSSLFVHGPFVVTAGLLPDLLRYSTLKRVPVGDHLGEHRPRGVFEVVNRQARSLSHFQQIHWLSVWGRALALQSRSIVHSINDLAAIGDSASALREPLMEFEARVTLYRATLAAREKVPRASIVQLQRGCERICQLASSALAAFLVREGAVMSARSSDLECLHDFIDRCDRGAYEAGPWKDEVAHWRSFYNQMCRLYSSMAAVQLGAEFPFHGTARSLAGNGIWLRRGIKRAVSVARALGAARWWDDVPTGTD